MKLTKGVRRFGKDFIVELHPYSPMVVIKHWAFSLTGMGETQEQAEADLLKNYEEMYGQRRT